MNRRSDTAPVIKSTNLAACLVSYRAMMTSRRVGWYRRNIPFIGSSFIGEGKRRDKKAFLMVSTCALGGTLSIYDINCQ